MIRTIRLLIVAAAAVLAAVVVGCASASRRSVGTVTTAGITEQDLRTRLSILAADSMEGRAVTNNGHERAVRYVESELSRFGLTPAGDRGSFRQTSHMRFRRLDPSSLIEVDGRRLRPTSDFRAFTGGQGELPAIDGAEVVFGGIVGDTTTQIPAELASGHIVVLGIPGNMTPARVFRNLSYGPSSRFGNARAVAIASLDLLPVSQRGIASTVSLVESSPVPTDSYTTTLLVTSDAARALMGRPLAGLAAGAIGRTVRGRLSVIDEVRATPNVVALLRGSDPQRRDEYIVLGAHLDHLGRAPSPFDHDSLRASARELILQRLPAGQRQLLGTASQNAPRTGAVARRDSIFNGADDDGSGSAALLEIAEAMTAVGSQTPRSIIFVWHTAEESVLMGSNWFVEHSPVPTDSIVAMMNLDMVGRGQADDVEGGGAGYLEVIGATRRSPALLSLISQVNDESATPAALHTDDPNGVFCRSDHWPYARLGIPVAFFTTGSHADYHSVTDEVQYIDYAKLRMVSSFVLSVTERLATGRERLEPAGKRPVSSAFCGG